MSLLDVIKSNTKLVECCKKALDNHTSGNVDLIIDPSITSNIQETLKNHGFVQKVDPSLGLWSVSESVANELKKVLIEANGKTVTITPTKTNPPIRIRLTAKEDTPPPTCRDINRNLYSKLSSETNNPLYMKAYDIFQGMSDLRNKASKELWDVLKSMNMFSNDDLKSIKAYIDCASDISALVKPDELKSVRGKVAMEMKTECYTRAHGIINDKLRESAAMKGFEFGVREADPFDLIPIVIQHWLYKFVNTGITKKTLNSMLDSFEDQLIRSHLKSMLDLSDSPDAIKNLRNFAFMIIDSLLQKHEGDYTLLWFRELFKRLADVLDVEDDSPLFVTADANAPADASYTGRILRLFAYFFILVLFLQSICGILGFGSSYTEQRAAALSKVKTTVDNRAQEIIKAGKLVGVDYNGDWTKLAEHKAKLEDLYGKALKEKEHAVNKWNLLNGNAAKNHRDRLVDLHETKLAADHVDELIKEFQQEEAAKAQANANVKSETLTIDNTMETIEQTMNVIEDGVGTAQILSEPNPSVVLGNGHDKYVNFDDASANPLTTTDPIITQWQETMARMHTHEMAKHQSVIEDEEIRQELLKETSKVVKDSFTVTRSEELQKKLAERSRIQSDVMKKVEEDKSVSKFVKTALKGAVDSLHRAYTKTIGRVGFVKDEFEQLVEAQKNVTAEQYLTAYYKSATAKLFGSVDNRHLKRNATNIYDDGDDPGILFNLMEAYDMHYDVSGFESFEGLTGWKHIDWFLGKLVGVDQLKMLFDNINIIRMFNNTAHHAYRTVSELWQDIAFIGDLIFETGWFIFLWQTIANFAQLGAGWVNVLTKKWIFDNLRSDLRKAEDGFVTIGVPKRSDTIIKKGIASLLHTIHYTSAVIYEGANLSATYSSFCEASLFLQGISSALYIGANMIGPLVGSGIEGINALNGIKTEDFTLFSTGVSVIAATVCIAYVTLWYTSVRERTKDNTKGSLWPPFWKEVGGWLVGLTTTALQSYTLGLYVKADRLACNILGLPIDRSPEAEKILIEEIKTTPALWNVLEVELGIDLLPYENPQLIEDNDIAEKKLRMLFRALAYRSLRSIVKLGVSITVSSFFNYLRKTPTNFSNDELIQFTQRRRRVMDWVKNPRNIRNAIKYAEKGNMESVYSAIGSEIKPHSVNESTLEYLRQLISLTSSMNEEDVAKYKEVAIMIDKALIENPRLFNMPLFDVPTPKLDTPSIPRLGGGN